MIYGSLSVRIEYSFVRPFVNPDNRMGVAQPHPPGFGDTIDKWHVAKKNTPSLDDLCREGYWSTRWYVLTAWCAYMYNTSRCLHGSNTLLYHLL